MEKLGQFLLKKLVITEFELENAIQIQKDTGSDLPRILLSEGYINSYKLYQTIAEYEQVDFADLIEHPCDKSLLKDNERGQYLALSVIPWKQEDGVTLIATCDINDETELWAHAKYGDHYRFVITSPFDISSSINKFFAYEDDVDAREKLWRYDPQVSAKELLGGKKSKIFLVLMTFVILLTFIYPKIVLTLAFSMLTFCYLAVLMFKVIVFFYGLYRVQKSTNVSAILDEDETKLPVYTILIPLYKEHKMLSKIVNAIRALDYPRSKLDVKFVVEKDDEETILAIKELKCERMFEIICVPFSLPQTKPKACNYALKFARGEYVTIYDVADLPEPAQLRKVLHKFNNEPDDLVCIQAKLAYFNREENYLTKLFSIEYSAFFDFIFLGFEALHIPILLGGSSTHFKIKALQELYAWDPYNVAEDTDIGIRIACKGWRTGLVDSVTLEEAPLRLKTWIKQRSRWIKGHMQTYLVHMRRPFRVFCSLKGHGFCGFQLALGVPLIIFLMAPIYLSFCSLFLIGAVDAHIGFPFWFENMLWFGVWVLALNIVFQVSCALIIVATNGWDNMFRLTLVYPFYWLLHSVASFIAVRQLINKPHYWEKTIHGETRFGYEET